MRKIVFSIAAVIFVGLCILFNEYDLNISIALTKHYNGFFEFFDDFGELPIYMGPILFGSTFFFLLKKNYQKILSAVISFVAYSIASVKVIHNMSLDYSVLNVSCCLVLSMLLTALTMFLFSKSEIETLEKIKDLAILGVFVSVVSFGLTEVIKYTWGRVRFRDLSADYGEFTRLFHINGITGHKSFPSGHTNAGTSILLIALLVPRFSDKKWLKYLTTALCFAYIATLAVSRIVVSAHYASDVLVGFAVGFLSLSVVYGILRRKGVINVASNKC